MGDSLSTLDVGNAVLARVHETFQRSLLRSKTTGHPFYNRRTNKKCFHIHWDDG